MNTLKKLYRIFDPYPDERMTRNDWLVFAGVVLFFIAVLIIGGLTYPY